MIALGAGSLITKKRGKNAEKNEGIFCIVAFVCSGPVLCRGLLNDRLDHRETLSSCWPKGHWPVREDTRMGVSTDAILCYGFRIKDEVGEKGEIIIPWLSKEQDQIDEEDDDPHMSFDDFLAKVIGLKPPSEHLDDHRYKTDTEYKKVWSDYFSRKMKLEDELGITLIFHCSGSYPMYILASKASEQCASRGCPIELGQSVVAQKGWRDTIYSFCELAGIPFKEPQFILCSFWSK